jgi:shikimate dehydrogenase
LEVLAYNQRVSEFASAPADPLPRYCAVYGHPIRHSASPAMQNAGIDALGLNWRYLAFEVRPENLRAAIAGAKAMNFIGLNLTVPHKLLAVDMVDALDVSARTWGAVNTIRFEAKDDNGEWQPLNFFPDAIPDGIRAHGFNTDADAITQSLREDLRMEVVRASVLVVGAGGAGRAAALKLASENVFELYLVNRTVARAEALAAEIRHRFPKVHVAVGYPKQPVDLVLNATSLGLMPGDRLPVDPKDFSLRDARAVYDMIYRPAETPLLRAAQAAGCRVANGLGMLLWQGARALELWSGKLAPLDVMRRALASNVYGEPANV